MTTREALGLQLDALRTEMNALEAENWRLKEDRPKQAAALENERALERSQEGNARLAQELDHLKELYEQLLRGTQEAEAEATPMAERCSALETEMAQLRNDLAAEREAHAEQRELASRLRGELENVGRHAEELDEQYRRLEHEQQQQLRDAELEQYRAVAEENRKWEARETRLVQRLEELEKVAHRESAAVFTPVSLTGQTEAVQAGANATILSEGGGADEIQETDRQLCQSQVTRQLSPQVHFRSELSPSQRSPSTLPRGGFSHSDPLDRGNATALQQPSPGIEVPEANPMSMAMLAQQLPPLPKFTGDSLVGSEEERFDEWLERLEMVADVCGWGEQAKLVNLITRLRGPAYSFYRSCTPQQRSSFQALSAALTERFTPVCLKAVQSSRFHERKQQRSETVDSYAQELKKLFYRAYPTAQQGSLEAEAMGQTVLACQFVTGLRNEIKAKVAGMDGEFEQLVTKARFEEAKIRDLADETVPLRVVPKKPFSPTATVTPPRGEGSRQQARDREIPIIRHPMKQAATTTARCFNCGIAGHLARNCRQRPRAPPETRGRYQGRNDEQVARIDVAGEAGRQSSSPHDRVVELRRQLKVAEVEEALNTVTATMKGITSPGDQENALLGPTVTAEVVFEGTPVLALLDTGSPVTIVSLDLVLKALAARRPETQRPEEWKKGVRARLEAPTITLRSYGGGELDIAK